MDKKRSNLELWNYYDLVNQSDKPLWRQKYNTAPENQ